MHFVKAVRSAASVSGGIVYKRFLNMVEKWKTFPFFGFSFSWVDTFHFRKFQLFSLGFTSVLHAL